MFDISTSLEKMKKYAKIKVINNNIQMELRDNIHVRIEYIQKLVNDIRENKYEVISIIQNYESIEYLKASKEYAVKKDYLAGDKTYVKQLAKNEYIFIDYIDDEWESYFIIYDNKNRVKRDRDIARDIDLISLINRTEKYIKFIKEGIKSVF